MKIGLVGYQGSGKSSLFRWLTGVEPDPGLAHTMQMATAPIMDPRMERLTEIYQPKKITHATLSIVDTPGLNRSHEGSAAKLAVIREAGCLVIVVAAFAGAKAADDLRSFQEDLLLADLAVVTSRVEKLRDSVKKPRPNRDKELAELELLERLLAHLESGQRVETLGLNPEQTKAVRSFQLLTLKPQFAVINVADLETDLAGATRDLPASTPAVALSVTLQTELEQMPPAERQEFCREMGVQPFNRDQLIRSVMDASGQMLFFTAGEKEVRTWIIPKMATAEMAAAGIHTDLARGFVRAEVMTCVDLFRLGSEREIKSQNLMRKEHKDYVIQDGDILHILANT